MCTGGAVVSLSLCRVTVCVSVSVYLPRCLRLCCFCVSVYVTVQSTGVVFRVSVYYRRVCVCMMVQFAGFCFFLCVCVCVTVQLNVFFCVSVYVRQYSPLVQCLFRVSVYV